MTDDIPKAAMQRAAELAGYLNDHGVAGSRAGMAFARFIADVSETANEIRLAIADGDLEAAVKMTKDISLPDPEPDVLADEALRLVIEDGTERTARQMQAIREGRAGHDKVALAYAALKRGQELAITKIEP